jgi:hypothetical protein
MPDPIQQLGEVQRQAGVAMQPFTDAYRNRLALEVMRVKREQEVNDSARDEALKRELAERDSRSRLDVATIQADTYAKSARAMEQAQVNALELQEAKAKTAERSAAAAANEIYLRERVRPYAGIAIPKGTTAENINEVERDFLIPAYAKSVQPLLDSVKVARQRQRTAYSQAESEIDAAALAAGISDARAEVTDPDLIKRLRGKTGPLLEAELRKASDDTNTRISTAARFALNKIEKAKTSAIDKKQLLLAKDARIEVVDQALNAAATRLDAAMQRVPGVRSILDLSSIEAPPTTSAPSAPAVAPGVLTLDALQKNAPGRPSPPASLRVPVPAPTVPTTTVLPPTIPSAPPIPLGPMPVLSPYAPDDLSAGFIPPTTGMPTPVVPQSAPIPLSSQFPTPRPAIDVLRLRGGQYPTFGSQDPYNPFYSPVRGY